LETKNKLETKKMSAFRNFLDRHIVRPLADWQDRRSAADELMGLDDHMLADIGIRRGDIPGIATGVIAPRHANENRPHRVA
jgi:uncharacterized protein YjiS (DUF1127 family)